MKLKHPLVLVHGLCGPERLSLSHCLGRDYFPGLRSHLERFVPRVLEPKLPPTGSVAVRAAELKRFLVGEVGTSPVHLIGHSLGGLDSRYAISRLGLKALTLTTIGTPHRGSSFADWGVDRFAKLLTPVFRAVGLSDQAFFDLRTDSCRRFNEDVPDDPEVRYFSVAGECSVTHLGAEWWLSANVVREHEGTNDGIVSVASAAWGEHFDLWAGDHLSLVNWPNRVERRLGIIRDRLGDYKTIMKRIKTTEDPAS